MPGVELWKAEVLGKLTPNASPIPGVAPHPSRVMWQWSRRLENSPNGYYRDGLVLIQLREKKDKESMNRSTKGENFHQIAEQ